MIDKIVYTYWTDKGTRLLCGFADETSFLKCAKSSIVKAQKIASNVVIYGDLEGKQYLESKGCTIDYIVVDYDQYTYNKGYWNFAKLITYSLQTEPFLHIDFDVRLKNTPANLDAQLLCEKQRPEVQLSYSRGYLPPVFSQIFYPYLMCSGILGGNNLTIWSKLLEVATPIAQRPGYVTFEMMYTLEETILTALARLNNIPYEVVKCKFTHYQGSEAKARLIPRPKVQLSDLMINSNG